MAVNETLIIEAFSRNFSGGVPPGMAEAAAIAVIPFLIIALLMGILLFVGWLWMIIDCAKRNKFKSGDRVVWILLLVLTGVIGMILYYFMVMREN